MYPTLLLLKTMSGFTGTSRIALRMAIYITLIIVTPVLVPAQSITEIITDYNGYWKSGSGLINSVKPDNSHNLVSFTYNGVRYSTGVDDVLLTANGQPFVAGAYKSLPVSQITGTVNGNTKIGLGQMYDGVHNGASSTAPQNNMVKYLTDGTKGLDLGTCVANLPVGDLIFPINNMQQGAIGDNIPDLIVTQTADPSSSALDSYEFTDIYGNRIGNKVDIVLNNLQVVGNWTADFYSAYQNPMVLPGGFTNTDRPLRLWTADFSSFGINSTNMAQIAYFRIRLNGNSDVAFVAYNEAAFTIIDGVLPVRLNWFRGSVKQQQVELSWQSLNEVNNDHFVIEHSTDGIHYTKADSVRAVGIAPHIYSYTHQSPATGKNWYRLKQVDMDGMHQYSQLVLVTINSTSPSITVYPNPVTNTLFVKQSPSATSRTYQVRNMQGVVLLEQTAVAGSTQQAIQVQNLPKGMYWLVWNDGSTRQVQSFVRK
jgi:hypothetical protein